MRQHTSFFGLSVNGFRLPALLCVAAGCLSTVTSAADHPKPGDAHKVFARDAGTWDCEVKMFFRGPNSPPAVFTGVEVNKVVSGDLYLQTSFKCQMGDRGEFEGHSLVGYDPRLKKYVGTWVDNFTAVPSQINGEYNENEKLFTSRRVVVDGSGNEQKSKDVTTWLDESTKKLEIFLVVEADRKEIEVKLMEMIAKKRN